MLIDPHAGGRAFLGVMFLFVLFAGWFFAGSVFYEGALAHFFPKIINSWIEAKKLLKFIGLKYTLIHACVNDYVLFCKEYKDLSECRESRYQSNTIGKIMS